MVFAQEPVVNPASGGTTREQIGTQQINKESLLSQEKNKLIKFLLIGTNTRS